MPLELDDGRAALAGLHEATWRGGRRSRSVLSDHASLSGLFAPRAKHLESQTLRAGDEVKKSYSSNATHEHKAPAVRLILAGDLTLLNSNPDS